MRQRLQSDELQRLTVLRRVPLEAVLSLLERCEIRELAAGDRLLTIGAANDTMYLVLAGSLSVHLDDAGEAEPVARLLAGQTVGELSVIDESPASATVIAAEPTRLIAVDDETFWALVSRSHEFAVNLLLLLTQRVRANNSVLSAAARLQRQLERDALVDNLTGLHNRRWLDQKLPRLARRSRVSGEPLSLLVIDVDHFKRFNDSYGHAAGDLVLATLGRTLMECLRPTDMPARYGGEEIVVLLPDTDREGALIAGERVRRTIREKKLVTSTGDPLPAITVSIGVAELDESGDHAGLFSRADSALYRAKHGGRDRVESA
jgi:diguanylate cyclase (GGDEF)-like protein